MIDSFWFYFAAAYIYIGFALCVAIFLYSTGKYGKAEALITGIVLPPISIIALAFLPILLAVYLIAKEPKK